MVQITELPQEILNHIHQNLIDTAKADARPAPAEPGLHPPPTPAQQARRALVARANFSRTCRLFHSIDKGNLSIKSNAETDCLVTENTIRNLAGSDKEHFTRRVRSLLVDKSNIGIDFSVLSEEQTHIVLDVLVERAKNGIPLHHLRFSADMDRVSSKLLRKINDAIPTISNTAAGENTVIEFACRSHDADRVAAPDLSHLTNLTSVDFSRCSLMNSTPDFSNNPKLKAVDLSRCEELTIKPDFSKNPELESVDLSKCRKLTGELEFSKNPKLKSIAASGCRELAISPNFSENPDLESVDLSGSARFTCMPDFSKNPKLISVDLSGCTWPGRLDFSKNHALKSVALNWCLGLSDELDFLHNHKLESVDLRWCQALEIAPVFSRDHLPQRVFLTMDNFSVETQTELRELLGERLVV